MESNQIPYIFKAHAPVQNYLNYLLAPVPSDDVLHHMLCVVLHLIAPPFTDFTLIAAKSKKSSWKCQGPVLPLFLVSALDP